MKPSDALRLHRDAIRQIVESHSASNPRVFGSTLRGEDTESSDLDILVDPIREKTTLYDITDIREAIEALTGVTVDVLTPSGLDVRFRDQVLNEAVPI